MTPPALTLYPSPDGHGLVLPGNLLLRVLPDPSTWLTMIAASHRIYLTSRYITTWRELRPPYTTFADARPKSSRICWALLLSPRDTPALDDIWISPFEHRFLHDIWKRHASTRTPASAPAPVLVHPR